MDSIKQDPRRHAVDVADWAHEEHEEDKRTRRKQYDNAGRADDHSL